MALVLVCILWIAASNHCELEAAGFVPGATGAEADTCCPHSSGGCDEDICGVAENAPILWGAKIVTVQAPVVCGCHVCLFSLEFAEPALPTDLRSAGPEPWLDWLPAWQFERRAVLPARAPTKLRA